MKLTGPIHHRSTGAVLHSGEGSLYRGRLEGADLAGANLRRAQLGSAKLDRADLRDAQFLFDGGMAYHANVRTDQLLRSRLSGRAESFVRHWHGWRLRWLAVRWWAAVALIVTLIAWYALRAVG